jgi:hypothetical protein
MPDAGHPLVARFDAAVAAVEARWEELGLQPRKLDRRELAAAPRWAGASPPIFPAVSAVST